MSVEIVDFELRHSTIEGLIVIGPKQITDERGTIREFYRQSALESAGALPGPFRQINVTESKLGTVRGMHAEEMTKLLGVASGEAFGIYVDLRPDSSTFGQYESLSLLPGVQVLVPAGVANGFQSLSDRCQYVYCFDAEWQPGMPGRSCTPLTPEFANLWPLPIDPDDPAQISAKDRAAPTIADLLAEFGAAHEQDAT